MFKTREEVIETVRCLLNMTTEKGCTVGEAATAARRVQAILFKYKLEMAEVETAETKEEQLISQDFFDLGIRPHEGKWRVNLTYRIARYNFCKAIGSWDDEHVYFIGTKTDVEIVKELYLWLVEQLEQLAISAWQEYFPQVDRRPTFIRSFYQGAVATIGSRLYEKWKELETETEMSTALVVQSDKAIKQYVEDQFGTLQKARYSSSGSYDGHKAGTRAGHQVDLNHKPKQLGR